MSKAKSSFKGFLFFFIILLVVAGTICAIVFWPQKPEEIKGAINSHAQTVLASDGDFITEYKRYGEYATDYHAYNATAKKSYDTAQNIFDGLQEYFYFVSYSFEFANFDMYNKGDIKTAQREMAGAKSSVDSITKFVKEKNDNLAKDGYNTKKYENADAQLIWQNISTDLKNTFKYYYGATEALGKIYRQNVKEGIYANEFAYQVVEGVGYYMNYFVTNHDDFASDKYNQMTTYFKQFVNKYIGENGGQRVAGQYLLSDNLIATAELLAGLDESLKEKDFTRKVLVEKGLSTEGLSATIAQFKDIEKAVVFYQGGVSK